MSIPGRPLDQLTQESIQRLIRHGLSRRKTARETGTCKRTVDKYAENDPHQRAKSGGNNKVA